MNPGKIKKHNGIDYAVDVGNRVRASASGIVVRASEQYDFGNLIVIDHAPLEKEKGRKIFTLYGHLNSMEVELGEFVLKGEDIGFSGEEGASSTGPHLHFGVFDSKYATDPLNWKADGTIGVKGYNASNPENYIGHKFELDGAILDINDLNDKTTDKVRRVMAVVTTTKGKGRNLYWRTDILVDGKNEGYMDSRKKILKLNFSPTQAIAFLRKDIKERKTDRYIVTV